MTRFLKAFIAGALIVGSLAGCGNPTGQEQSGRIELTYWCNMPAAMAAFAQSMDEMTMYKQMEKQTGIKIKFVHPPSGQAKEQFNLMIASRELTDLIEYNWIASYPGGPDKAINDNVIIKLNDIIEKKAPNFYKAMKADTSYDKQSKTDSGTYYGFPTLVRGNYRTFGGLLIRQDWLDDLGLPSPNTLEEWETTLRAFQRQKGAQYPFTATNSIFSMINIAGHFNNFYDIGLGVYVDNGKVKLAQLEPGYKDFIMLMNKWYKEGLLDNQYDTNNSSAVDAKMTNGTSGVTYGFIGATIGRYMSAMSEKDPNYNLTAAQYPLPVAGGEPRFMEYQNDSQEPQVVVTTANKHPQETVAWLDYLYSPEGDILKNFGVEGFTFQMVDNKPVYTDEILNNPAGLSIAEAMAKHFRANAPFPGFSQHEDYLMQYYQLPQQRDALLIWTKYSDNAKDIIVPRSVVPSIDEAEEISVIQSTITTYIEEMTLKFIKGTTPISEYDKFVKKLHELDALRFVELRQAAFDRYNKR
ncbi:MAG: extracellular solute-binding protein [Firmicutes bacterium]|nr:extracellular solute-binding protein [Bacillota bacterium]